MVFSGRRTGSISVAEPGRLYVHSALSGEVVMTIMRDNRIIVWMNSGERTGSEHKLDGI